MIEISKIPNGIRLSLTDRGKAEIGNMMDKVVFGELEPDSAFRDMLESCIANGWDFIRPEEIGALTGALLISDNAERDEDGKLISCKDVYYFNYYALTLEIEELAEHGYIDFVKSTCCMENPASLK